MPRNYFIGAINYEDIKFNIKDQSFFNFQFEAPQEWIIDQPNNNNIFWFKISHPVHIKKINYPYIRRSQSSKQKSLIEIKQYNKYKYFLKFVMGKKKCQDDRESTIKK